MNFLSYRRPTWQVGGLAFWLITLAVSCQAEPSTASALPLLPENASLLSAIAKVIGALLVVVGLMLVLLYAIKRLGLGGGRGGGSAIAVLETRMVAPRKYITIVRVADRCLALGITEQTISLLADLGEDGKAAFANQGPPPPPAGFAALLQKSMQSWRAAPPEAGGQSGTSPQERQEEP